jgi:putative flippase GtrA/LmbE family N-acetylglucosaminyl deacetylase
MEKKVEKTGLFNSAKKILRDPRLMRYLFVGGTTYVAEMAVLYILEYQFRVSPFFAVSISFWFGLTIGFILQKFAAFGDARNHRKIILKQVILYMGLVGWNYLFTIFMTGLLAPRLSTFVARTIAIAIITSWNYLFYLWLFRKSSPDKTLGSKIIHNDSFKKYYGSASALVLLLTTLYWSYLGALIHMGNADQLVDPLLFENASVFEGAQFPAAHTFLLKWPLFLIIRMANYSTFSFIATTICLSLLSVIALAAIIRRIDQRPLVWGTSYLALTCVLLMVPAQPIAGAWLPVNFAMLATRNLEYVVYLAILSLLAYRSKIFSWRTAIAALLLLLLAVSDKLFLYYSLAGASLQLILTAVVRQWHYFKTSLRWLVVSGAVYVGTTGALWLINFLGITQINSGTAPYGLVNNLDSLLVAVVYGLLGVATNMGANPVYDVVVLSSVIKEFWQRIPSLLFLPFLINILLLALSVVGSVKTITSVVHAKLDVSKRPLHQFFLMLASSSLAALGLSLISNHYYPVDARYLTICFFTLFLGGVIYFSQKKINPGHLVGAGLVLTLGIAIGLVFTTKTHNQEAAAVATVNSRNKQIAAALESRRVDSLVGDYWRVVPTKLSAKQNLNITPLADCDTPRDSLTSTAWQPDLSTVRFAYLLSYDEKRTDFPECDPEKVVESYGQPNATVVIEGDHEKPKEQLLFYDHGLQPDSEPEEPSTIAPVSIEMLPKVRCQETVMQVVAHQDDDLLFMSPDLPKAIADKKCIRTIYLTSGDGGSDAFYWLGREQGSEAAYSKMLGIDTSWMYRVVKLGGEHFVTVANPKNNPAISLIYLHLPDGNLNGEGFASTQLESLSKLHDNLIPSMTTVDKQSSYTKDQLVNLLLDLMRYYNPTELRIQSSFRGTIFPDHSDHLSAGKFAKLAYQVYSRSNSALISYYLGYPIREHPENIAVEFLSLKQDAFFAYGRFDGGVCKTVEECVLIPTYDSYLKRQYTYPN